MNCPRCGAALNLGPRWCPRCGQSLPEPGWVAHPPPHARIVGAQTAPAPPPGPTPTYGPIAPRWGFRPVAHRRSAPELPPIADPAPWLRAATSGAAATAVVLTGAAVAETWQYVLMVVGRTRVLNPTPVRLDRALAVAFGWTGLALAVLTAALVVVAVVRQQAAMSRRLGVGVRRRSSVVLRFCVPLWNLTGAPQNLIETHRLLARLDPDVEDRRRVPARLLVWWGLWLAGAVAAVATLVLRFGSSTQAAADAVLSTAVTSALGAALAVTTVVVLRGYRSSTAVSARWRQWRVAAPLPNRPQPAEDAERQQERIEMPGTEGDVATLAITSATAAGSQLVEDPPTTVTRT